MASTLYGEIRQLVQEGLYESAAVMCEFSSAQPGGPSAKTLQLHADALCGLKEWVRARGLYQQCIEIEKKATKRSGVSSELACLQLRVAECNAEVGEEAQCLDLVATLPAGVWAKYPKNQRKMAELAARAGRTELAVELYSSILNRNPRALEAAKALLRLGAEEGTILSKLQKKEAKVPAYMAKLISAESHMKRHRFLPAIEILAALDKAYPKCPAVLSAKGFAEAQYLSPEEAHSTLAKLHTLAPTSLTRMETLAFLYQTLGHVEALRNLSFELLSTSQIHPEPWIACALLTDQTDSSEEGKSKSMEYVERAIELSNKQFAPAFLAQGLLFMNRQEPVRAVTAFRKAHELDGSNMKAFQGIVQAFLEMKQLNPALVIAKEALKLGPKNPKSLTLVGIVLSNSVDTRPKAIKAFNKAISVDPNCFDAILALAKLYARTKQVQLGIELLKKYNSGGSQRDFLHVEMAQMYMQAGETLKAMDHYSAALALTPDFVPALQGMEELEKLIRSSDEDSMEQDATEYGY